MHKFDNFSIYIFKVVFSLLVLFYLFNQIDTKQLFENIKKLNLIELLFPVVLYIFAHLMNAVKLNKRQLTFKKTCC